jgi:hypothetical protein
MTGMLIINGTAETEMSTCVNRPNSLVPVGIRIKSQPSVTANFLFGRWNKSPDVLM